MFEGGSLAAGGDDDVSEVMLLLVTVKAEKIPIFLYIHWYGGGGC